MKCLRWIAAALAAPLLLAGQASADFDFSTAVPVPPSPATFTFSNPAVTVTFQPNVGTGEAETSGAITLVNFPRVTADGYSGTTPVSVDVTITEGAQTVLLTVSGTITVVDGTGTFTGGTGSLTGSTSDFVYTLVPATGTVTMPSDSTPGTGAFTMLLTVTPVPEPTSMALVAAGGLLFAAPRLRRLVRRIGQSS